ncbi:MAG TPA: class I SAM-dependent methyltransferase [Syntrophobacteraceae bacterium]|nr:class I SAM-dependent methyltransferase [Syntrophobacteraceae bacterium]
MGYVFSWQDAQAYEDWMRGRLGRLAVSVEQETIQRVWRPRPNQRLLEVGCGSGLFSEWFAERGLQVTALDPSVPMLNLARLRLPARVSLERGYAEDLPFADNSFDVVAMITTLEFVDDPAQALREACRVAREQVLLGVLNKYSLIAWQRRIQQLWNPGIYRHARFFGVIELQRLVRETLNGSVPTHWRTCLTFPLWALRTLITLERSPHFQWHPLGHFIAMVVDLRYILRTIQQPLFRQIPTRVGTSQPHPTCWRIPRREHQDHRPCANL